MQGWASAEDFKRGEVMTDPAPLCIGIDVSKHFLDVASTLNQEVQRLPHDPSGCLALIGQLRQAEPERIVLEAKGGLERGLALSLAAAKLPVCVVNPPPGAAVRPFHRPLGQDRHH
jgi:transposase